MGAALPLADFIARLDGALDTEAAVQDALGQPLPLLFMEPFRVAERIVVTGAADAIRNPPNKDAEKNASEVVALAAVEAVRVLAVNGFGAAAFDFVSAIEDMVKAHVAGWGAARRSRLDARIDDEKLHYVGGYLLRRAGRERARRLGGGTSIVEALQYVVPRLMLSKVDGRETALGALTASLDRNVNAGEEHGLLYPNDGFVAYLHHLESTFLSDIGDGFLDGDLVRAWFTRALDDGVAHSLLGVAVRAAGDAVGAANSGTIAAAHRYFVLRYKSFRGKEYVAAVEAQRDAAHVAAGSTALRPALAAAAATSAAKGEGRGCR